MIVADTGAILALVDADDRHHAACVKLFQRDPGEWVLPWAILPEVDYLLLNHVGIDAELAFLNDIARGRYTVEWEGRSDLVRAHEICDRYRDLKLGLVDGIVIAVAERLHASAIATIDERHFAAVRIRGKPRLLPRDA